MSSTFTPPFGFKVAEWLPRVTSLRADNIDEFWKRLPELPCVSVSLTLDGAPTDTGALPRMSRVLCSNKNIKRLQLCVSNVYPATMITLSSIMDIPDLDKIDVCLEGSAARTVNAKGVIKVLARSLEENYGPTDLSLSLEGNSGIDVSPIFAALKRNTQVFSFFPPWGSVVDFSVLGDTLETNDTLSNLKFAACKFVTSGKSLRLNKTLEELRFFECYFNDDTTAQLVHALCDTADLCRFENLSLDLNQPEIAAAFIQYLMMTENLRELIINGYFPESFTKNFFRVFRYNTTVQELSIQAKNPNPIDFCVEIAEMVNANSILKKISVEDTFCVPGKNFKEKLNVALSNNTTIQSFTVTSSEEPAIQLNNVLGYYKKKPVPTPSPVHSLPSSPSSSSSESSEEEEEFDHDELEDFQQQQTLQRQQIQQKLPTPVQSNKRSRS